MQRVCSVCVSAGLALHHPPRRPHQIWRVSPVRGVPPPPPPCSDATKEPIIEKKIDFKQTIIDFQEKTILTSLVITATVVSRTSLVVHVRIVGGEATQAVFTLMRVLTPVPRSSSQQPAGEAGLLTDWTGRLNRPPQYAAQASNSSFTLR